MSILINSNTKVVVQGITGSEGTFHSEQMIDYGTNIVAGVTPGKGGEKVLNDIPVYNTVKEARDNHGANASIIFVPGPNISETPKSLSFVISFLGITPPHTTM